MQEGRSADRGPHHAVDDLDRVFVVADLDQPGRRAARSGHFQLVSTQPDHEHLGLDRPRDVDPVR